jgi:hypothetical protein
LVNAGELTYLVYRGEPTQATPLPYYGGGMDVQEIAGGIPVGQDPRFPMSQEQFEQYVDERRLKKSLEPYGGSILEFIRRNPQVKGASLPGTPGNFGGVQNMQFYAGPQVGQAPPGFQNKFVS